MAGRMRDGHLHAGARRGARSLSRQDEVEQQIDVRVECHRRCGRGRPGVRTVRDERRQVRAQVTERPRRIVGEFGRLIGRRSRVVDAALKVSRGARSVVQRARYRTD